MQIKYLFITIIITISVGTYGQNLKLDTVSIEDILTDVDIKPLFPGCDVANSLTEKTNCSDRKMADYIDNNLVYPSSAKENGRSGTVVIDIEVLKDGSLGQIKVVREPSVELGQATIDLINRMKNLNEKWIPAMKDGKVVSAWYRLPVKFRLYNKVNGQKNNIRINYSFKNSYPIDSILCIEDHCTTPEIKESFSHYYSIESISGQTYFRVSRNNSATKSNDPIISRSRLTWTVRDIEINLVNGKVIKSKLETTESSYRKILNDVEYWDYYFPINENDVKVMISYPIKKVEFGYYNDKQKLKSANTWTPDKKLTVQISKWVKEMVNNTK